MYRVQVVDGFYYDMFTYATNMLTIRHFVVEHQIALTKLILVL